jgi:cell division transport system ATP-binding protein
MATHDVGIVDQMQRRVIELVSGQVVRDERGGSYQTQAVPVVREPVRVAAPAPVVAESAIDDLSYARPEPSPTPAPAPDAPVTSTITIVEPEVTTVRETPVAPRAEPVPGDPTPLVPPPLNEPRRR